MPAPFKILEANKKSALDYATEIANAHQDTPSLTDLQAKLEQQMSSAKSIDFFAQAIETLSEIKDKKAGIHTYKSEDLGNGTKALVRDGRDAKQPPIITPESYAIQFLNHTRAAISVAEEAGKRGKFSGDLETFKQQAMHDAMAMINHIKNVPDAPATEQNAPQLLALEERVTSANTKLAVDLINHGIENADQRIKSAKDFAGLKDEHYHVVTLSRAKHKDGRSVTVMETEVMNLGLTEDQRKMFEKIKENKDLSKDQDMTWFTSQPTWKQDQIRATVDDVLSEKKVIPTQLRKELPLLRNSYTKVTSVIIGGQERKDILETMHSGTLSIDTGNDNRDAALTKGNIKQLKQFAGPGEEKIHLNPLTSPVNRFDLDHKENLHLTQATKEDPTVTKSTTPFNFLRMAPGGGGRDFSGFTQALSAIGEKLEDDNLKNIGAYLKSGKDSDLKAATEQLSKLEDKELRQSLTNAVEAKRKIESITYGSDPEHTHSQITTHMLLLVSDANREESALQKKLGDDVVSKINTNCASGKDRTGVQEIDATRQAVNQALDLNEQDDQAKQNLRNMLSAGHTQHIAGTQGGTPGCFGVRPSTAKESKASVYSEVSNYFGQRTAKLNKFEVKSGEISEAKRKMDYGNDMYFEKLFTQLATMAIKVVTMVTKYVESILEKTTKISSNSTYTNLIEPRPETPRSSSSHRDVVKIDPPSPGGVKPQDESLRR